MNFLDRSGHIFNLTSYPYEPIGHEFEENDYIFWIDNPKMNKLSINNYYVKTIYLVVPFDKIPSNSTSKEFEFTPEQKEEIIKNHPMTSDDTDGINTLSKYIDNIVAHDTFSFSDVARVTISSQSNKFCLIRPTDIQDLTSGAKNITDYIDYDLSTKNRLVYINSDNDDLCAVIVSLEDEMSSIVGDDEKINSLRKHSWSRENLAIIPIYVLCMSPDEGTWITNLLIHVENKISNIDENDSPQYYDAVNEDWCSISVGAEFSEENEILHINGKNMGIDLPKDMFKAIYQNSFINNEFNEELYNEKLKEYLINYMEIKGECGNYNSVINSLKWFGYGDKMTISKLLRTDNEFKYQYLKDYFNITTDVLKSFNFFKNSTYIALTLSENSETGNYNENDISKNVYGEGTPELEDNFKKLVTVEYDWNNEKFKYVKPYYDFTFNEMGLKIACLKYYYKKYFLPLHLKIHSASIAHKVYTNDIKFNNEVYKTILSEHPVLLGNMNEHRKVLFEKSNVKYFMQSKRYVDNKFNEFYSYNPNRDDVYEIDDTCLSIPVHFVNDYDLIDVHDKCNCHKKIKKEKPTYFSCVLLLEKEYYIEDTYLPYRLEFNVPIQLFKDTLSLYNKDTKRKENFEEYQFAYSKTNDDDKNWSQWITGIENLKKYILSNSVYEIYAKDYDTDPSLSSTDNIKLRKEKDEVQIELFDELIDNNVYQSFYAINCDNIIIEGKKLTDIVKDENVLEELTRIIETYYENGSVQNATTETYNGIRLKEYAQEIMTDTYYLRIPSIYDLRKNPINIYDISADIIYVPKLYVKMKYDKTEIYDFKLNNVSYKKNVKINFVKETSLIYESHFNFVQNPNDPTTMYHSFILYPRMMNNKDINFFVNQEFKLKLLVNDQWYEYKFIAKMTDIDIQFGKLAYKYWSNENKFISRFRQLSDESILNESEPDTSFIKFNSYMHEPSIITINDINYLHHLENYVTKYNIISLGDDMRNKGCNFIKYDGIKIFFNIDKIRSEAENDTYVFQVSPEEVLQTFDKDPLDPTMFVLNRFVNFAKRQLFNYKHEWNNVPSMLWESLYKNVSTIWEDYKIQPQTIEEVVDYIATFGNITKFFYDNDKIVDDRERYLYVSSQKFYYDSTNEVIYTIDENGQRTNYEMHKYEDYLENLKLSSNRYFNNFVMNINLPHNRKYLNNLQLFDIYTKQTSISNLFTWSKYTNLCCNGVLFYHSNTYNSFIKSTFEYDKMSNKIILTKNNAIRISGTPLWDDDVYSNDVDLYSNYTNYDITTKDNTIYDYDNGQYIRNESGELALAQNDDYRRNEVVPFNSAHQVISENVITLHYSYFLYEDFTGKRYYTVENLNNYISGITEFNKNNTENKHIQISNLFGIYSICHQNNQDILFTPRPEQYSVEMAIEYDPLFDFSSYTSLDSKLDQFNKLFNYSELTHVCDLYVDSLFELSSENTDTISFDGNNVIWDNENLFTKESTTIERCIVENEDDQKKYAYFIMTNYERFIYRQNDIKENITDDIKKLFERKVMGEKTGLLLYYKLSYAIKESNIDENGNEYYSYRKINSNELDNDQINEIAIGHSCGDIKICVHLYYNMSEESFISDRYGKEILIDAYNSTNSQHKENSQLIKDFTDYANDWRHKRTINKPSLKNESTKKLIYSMFYSDLTDYFRLYEIYDDYEIYMPDTFDPESKYAETLNAYKERTKQILVGNVLNTVYVNEHNNEVIPDLQPGQYIYSITQEELNNKSLKDILDSLNRINSNNTKDGYEKRVLDLSNDAISSIKDFYTSENLRESLRNNYENRSDNSKLERIDDFTFKNENIYTIKRIANQEGKVVLDFELFFDPAYYDSLTYEGEEMTEDIVKSTKDTYMADYLDIYHKDKVWTYEYYTPNYLKNNMSMICVIRHNDNENDAEVKEIEYTTKSTFKEEQNTIYLKNTDVMYVYIKIHLDKNTLVSNHGVQNRIRIPEFYIVPIVLKYDIEMTKLKYRKPVSDDNITYNSLYEALLTDERMTSNDYENFKKLFSNQNSKIYTEFFEQKYMIRNEDNSMYEMVTKEMYDIERLYDLEKQYSIWSKTNKLMQTNGEHSICVKDETNEPMYFDINTNISTDKIVTDINDLSNADKTNLVNFAKYQYSIIKDTDFYECKTYFNNDEVIANDYVYDKKYTKFISPKVSINMFLDYDMYLMHDNDYWYVIFISQQTIDKVDNEAKLKLLDEQKTLLSYNSKSFDVSYEIERPDDNKIVTDFYYNYTPYELRYVKSNNDFLINRMKFISSEGVNIFNNDDIIVGSITNNHRLPIHMIHSSKWNIKPLSYGINFTKEFNSNTEMCILSYPEKMNTIEHGYYDVRVRYSLDRNVSHQYNKKAKLKIK